MSTTPTFGTQIIGQTEKALNVILERLLAGTGLTERQWVTLTLTVMLGGTVESAELAERVAGALKVTPAQAQMLISDLVKLQLLRGRADNGLRVTVTHAGGRLHAEIRAAVTDITQRLWGDLPTEDLATAGRVLSTILARANAQLA